MDSVLISGYVYPENTARAKATSHKLKYTVFVYSYSPGGANPGWRDRTFNPFTANNLYSDNSRFNLFY